MNKQALAFLTLFSLILMLSVYYVTLPPDGAMVIKNEKTSEKAASKKANNADILKEDIETKKKNDLEKNANIIADSKAKAEQKKIALQKIDQLKDSKLVEEQLCLKLKEAGYKSVVEIQDKSCKVTIFDQAHDASIAGKIIKQIDELTKKKYFTEVTFK
ncbi:MAG: stage III sporulation protein AH [Erysipelotrichaceae bacterium]